MMGCDLLLLLHFVVSTTLAIQTTLVLDKPTKCDCTGFNVSADPSSVCGDYRLGPKILPSNLPLLSFVSDYHRFGDLSPVQFIDRYWRNGRWRYPCADGFQNDTLQIPIKGEMDLAMNLLVDRFGLETGSFMGAADAPFAQRALPPDALHHCPKETEKPKDPAKKCNPKEHPYAYHVYRVNMTLRVFGGPVTSWFEQPGLGTQFDIADAVYLEEVSNTVVEKSCSIEICNMKDEKSKDRCTGNNHKKFKCQVSDLVKLKVLETLDLSAITLGPGPGGDCGTNPAGCTGATMDGDPSNHKIEIFNPSI